MTFFPIILLTLGLSTDLFAVTVSSTLDNKTFKEQMMKVASFFTMFQVLFILAGWLLGNVLEGLLGEMAQALIFAIFTVIGLKMIWEAFKIKPEERNFPLDNFKVLLAVSMATAFNALIVGIGVNFASIPLKETLVSMSISALVLSLLGLIIGKRYGCRYKGKWMKVLGGLTLIGVGIWYLLQYRGIL